VKYLEGLNDAQKEAVLHTEGPLLIVAGAGAGKTKTLTTRIIHLIHEGIKSEQILAVTFTNKAASEMRDRVRSSVVSLGMVKLPLISTFHSLGVRLLREMASLHGRGERFKIFDTDDSTKIYKEVIQARGYNPKEYDPKSIRNKISALKNKGTTVSLFRESVETSYDETLLEIWESYEKTLEEERGFDFDDLILTPIILLKRHTDRQDQYKKTFQYILVDEYQDTNEVQYELIRLLLNQNHNICAVGDADQNIYSWRGATLKNILRFEHDFPGAKIVFLEQNYRSTKVILEAANTVIAKNVVRIPKNLFTKVEGGEQITRIETYDEKEEARTVIDEFVGVWDSGVKPEDCAILYRANFQSRVFEEECLRRNIPYQLVGTKFFERKEVKDIIAYIHGARDPKRLSDIKRIINTPSRGIGKATVAKIFAGEQSALIGKTKAAVDGFYALLKDIHECAEKALPSELIRFIIVKSGMDEEFKKSGEFERLENIEELVSLATEYDLLGIEKGIEALLEHAALESDQDDLEKPKEGIRLMTIHAAKGLEFDTVFIVGLEHGLFPHIFDGTENREDGEEERRLFYVALTRAKRKLFLTYATTRTIFGKRELTIPSEFLYDIPESLVELRMPEHGIKTIYLE
jgi:DNA helicase-2/ATP-dependent DNA helicase PcrA